MVEEALRSWRSRPIQAQAAGSKMARLDDAFVRFGVRRMPIAMAIAGKARYSILQVEVEARRALQ
jgi:hypothetical protein